MKIAILGYGKMGQTIEELALAGGHEIVLRIHSGNLADRNPEALVKADVAIEFSTPETAFSNIRLCLENGVPVVSGTTAWLDQLPAVHQLCDEKKGAFFYASNFSIGVHLFFAVNRFAARLLNDQAAYEPRLEETHHLQKLDAPSGTAISLAEIVLDELKRKTSWVKELTDNPEELSILSYREAGVPGTHRMVYQAPEDTIELVHTAHTRAGFAKGALQAAQWLMGKQGCFGMKDMLGF